MYIASMLKDSIDGSLSSKRVVTILAFILCAIAFVANLFFGMTMERFIFDTMAYIAMAGLGATVAEKFTAAEKVRVEQRYQASYSNQYQPPQYGGYTPPYNTPAPYNTPRGRRLPNQEDPLI